MSSERYTIARLKIRGMRFEIFVDPDKALEYKLGRRREFEGILAYDVIFSDAKKGLKPSRKDLIEAFGTDDVKKIAKEILDRGELLITAKQREKLIEDKKRQIIAYISKYCIDARTNAPIPPLRVERALDQVGVKIDPFKGADEQLPEIISRLSSVIPIKKQIVKLAVKVPATYSGKAYGYIKGSCEVESEKWLNDGSYYAEIILPAGFKNEFVDKILGITRGAAYVEVLEERTV